MADYPTLHAKRRELRGKAVRHLRRAGVTPIVVYGADTEPVALQTETNNLVKVLSVTGGTQLISIEVEGEDTPRLALARELQRHVTRLTPLHADFLQVDVLQLISSEVPVVVDGDPALVRQGEAILQMPINAVTVQALPTELPSVISIDAARFTSYDDAVYVRDLEVGEGVRVLDDPDELVVRLAPSKMALAEELVAEELREELLAELEGEELIAEEEEAAAAETPATDAEPQEGEQA